MYDRCSPGHVLSVHEKSAQHQMLRWNVAQRPDFDVWGDDSLLQRAISLLNGNIGGTVRSDLGAIAIDTVNFNEVHSCRPGPVMHLLGRRTINDFSFIGGMVIPRHNRHAVYFLLYVEDGQPRAYIPTQGNALGAQGPITDLSYGERDYAYDGVAIEGDIRSRFGLDKAV